MLNMNYTEYTFLCWHILIVKFTTTCLLKRGLMRADPIVLQEVYTVVLEHETPIQMLPCPVSVCVYASSVIKKTPTNQTTFISLS